MMITTCWILWIPVSGWWSPLGPRRMIVRVGCGCPLEPQPLAINAATRQPLSKAFLRIGALLLKRTEVLLACSAHGAEPSLRNVFEGGAGRDAAVGVTLIRVVDEPARLAHPLHRRQM